MWPQKQAYRWREGANGELEKEMKRNEVRQTEVRMKEGVRLRRRESEYCICHTAAGGRERGEKRRICQSLYGSLHVMCLSCDDLCSYVPY